MVAAEPPACENESGPMDVGGVPAGNEARLRRILEVGRSVVSEFDLEAVLARVLDEARGLTSARYAALGVLDEAGRATHVDVVVREQGDSVEAVIGDNGIGFDAKDASAGYGLLGMRERIALIGGALRIESIPSEGTTVRASVPTRRVEHGSVRASVS